MRTTTITSTASSTSVHVCVNDFKCELFMPHDIIPEELAMKIATSISQIPSAYDRRQDKELKQAD